MKGNRMTTIEQSAAWQALVAHRKAQQAATDVKLIGGRPTVSKYKQRYTYTILNFCNCVHITIVIQSLLESADRVKIINKPVQIVKNEP